MPKVRRVVVALSVSTLLLAALVVLATGVPAAVVAQGSGNYNTLRVYGRANYGAGDPYRTDPFLGRVPEDAPYSDLRPVFDPQLLQAPVKDSITWNPAFMSEFDTPGDENGVQGLYNEISAGSANPNATEKVWFRMWYEPWHWDKDLNANGVLDGDPATQLPYAAGTRDEWYPAVMQEFTYMLLEPKSLAEEPLPLAGSAGQTKFVFPVGMRKNDLFSNGQVPLVDSTSTNARYGYGLTSLDGDFDGRSDIVWVDSENTLSALTGISADFDGSGGLQSLDFDGVPLSGDELVVLRLGSKALARGQAVQFLDHLVVVREVHDTGVEVEIFYTGDMTPNSLGSETLNTREMILSGRNTNLRIPAGGGNFGIVPPGPFFVYLESIDQQELKARLIVGHALGDIRTAMESAPNQQDLTPGDPWFLKRFYVDGHEYNVVAIQTRGTDGFEFITLRTPIPKWGEYDDPQVGYLIRQHSVRLQPYLATDYLSVLPPYNYEHYILIDVQAITSFACYEAEVPYFGTLVGPVPPILQNNGPFPYIGTGRYSPYNNRREMTLFYVEEDKNWQFFGELKEKYGQNTEGTTEFWYVEQFHTLPWEYTEFILPDLGTAYTGNLPDLYLLTSAFLAPQSEYALFSQNFISQTYNLRWDTTVQCWVRDPNAPNTMPGDWRLRVKFWFDPAVGGKKYKDAQGVRLYGLNNEGAGDSTVTTDPNGYPVEVQPYTDPWAPFNPQFPQAPRKDSLTFNPAYMDRFYNGGEALVSLYNRLTISGQDAREKVFFRMWYEPLYLDKILRISPSETYSFPAVMQEFTYMFLDTNDKPAHGQPGTSLFAFPMATGSSELPKPLSGGQLPSAYLPSFGYGLTSFDANFDGTPDAVRVHSEATLMNLTGIRADFDGSNTIDQLTPNPVSGMVVFTTQDMTVRKGQSVQFLDHMLTLDNVAPGQTWLSLWYTGGGQHPVSGGYSLHPDWIGQYTLPTGGMAIVNRSTVRVLLSGGNNLGSVDGAWFVWVKAVSSVPSDEYATLVVGRALGHVLTAMDNGNGSHDMSPGDPWYLKRFFVDGHEYNVVALGIEPTISGLEPYEFKYITIRTPVPKVNFINRQDSQKLEGYFQGTVFGVNTAFISVMPPFNYEHTVVQDIQTLPEKAIPSGGTTEQFVFGNLNFRDSDCRGDLLKNVPPYQIRIVDEAREPQFFGELKEMYGLEGQIIRWQTEQWHTVPDQYTELRLPSGQKYLLTSDWESDQSRVAYYGCDDPYYTQDQLRVFNDNIRAVNRTIAETNQSFFEGLVRVKFLYDPADSKDIYVNTWPISGGVGNITGIVKLQGRTNHSGAVVTTGSVTTTTSSDGSFTLSDVPVGTHSVTADMVGYLYAVKTGVVVNVGETTVLPQVQLLGGDADDDCTIDLFDLIAVSSLYGGTPPAGSGVDINGNGVVDLFDLVMVAKNLDKTCPATWSSSPAPSPVHVAAPAHLRILPAEQNAKVGNLLTVTVEVEDVSNLYAVDLRLNFNPSILQVVDADSNYSNSIQITAGPFPAGCEIGKNTASNTDGTILYAATLTRDVPGANGSGTLCTITFRARAPGMGPISVAAATLSDPALSSIPVIAHDGAVHVAEGYWIYLPTVRKAGEPR